MMHFEHRHPGPELMDAEDIDQDSLRSNLDELDQINRYLGGHQTTLECLSSFNLQAGQSYSILDVGCGGGDNLKAVNEWALAHGIKLKLYGLDLSETAVSFAKERWNSSSEVTFIHASFEELEDYPEEFDIIFCSLFCHHLYGNDLNLLLQLMHKKSRLGFFINDLERHRLAWLGISILTTLLSKSHLVKNDAPLSVRRGFTSSDWRDLLDQAMIKDYAIQKHWAFRHGITARKHA